MLGGRGARAPIGPHSPAVPWGRESPRKGLVLSLIFACWVGAASPIRVGGLGVSAPMWGMQQRGRVTSLVVVGLYQQGAAVVEVR